MYELQLQSTPGDPHSIMKSCIERLFSMVSFADILDALIEGNGYIGCDVDIAIHRWRKCDLDRNGIEPFDGWRGRIGYMDYANPFTTDGPDLDCIVDDVTFRKYVGEAGDFLISHGSENSASIRAAMKKYNIPSTL